MTAMQPQADCSPKTIRILADDRERTARVVNVLRGIAGVEVICQRLKLGDYEINEWLFERKTLPDFAESIKDGRLFCQAKRLVSAGQPVAFILEGRTSDLAQSGMRREALQGAMVSLSLIFQIPILRSFDPNETAHLLLYAGQQLQRDRNEQVIRHRKRPKRRRKLQLYVLQGLPGIGPEKAERLLEQFGSIERVVAVSQKELQLVSGIGDKIAEKIRWILAADECNRSAP